MEKVKSNKIKTSAWDKVFVVCNTLFMIAFVVITLYPVLNTLAISFNDGTDALRGGIYLLPRKWTLKNYITETESDHRSVYHRCKNGDRNAACAGSKCNSGVYREPEGFSVQAGTLTVLGYHHVCKRWYDSDIPVVQRSASD